MIHSLLSGLPDIFDGEDPPHEGQVDTSVKEDVQQSQSDCDPERTVMEEGHSMPFPALVEEEPFKKSSGILTEGHLKLEESTMLSEDEDTLVEPSLAEDEEDSVSSHAVSDVLHRSDSSPECKIAQVMSEVVDEPTSTATSIKTSIADDQPSDLHLPSHSRENTGDSAILEDMPLKPCIALSSLLQRADELHLLYPPSHPSIRLSSIMGPQSVMLTWSEKASELPSEEEAELMVTQPQLIILPLEEIDTKEKTEVEEIEMRKAAKRRRRKLRKPVRIGSVVVEQRTVVASAVLVLGVAMAVYGLQATPDRHHGASKELKKLTRYVGGLVLGFGGRLWDRLLTDR
jgi:TBC1 domain family member 20